MLGFFYKISHWIFDNRYSDYAYIQRYHMALEDKLNRKCEFDTLFILWTYFTLIEDWNFGLSTGFYFGLIIIYKYYWN